MCSRSPTGPGMRERYRRMTTSPDGRVMEMLSEHQCQGWLEGYLLTGRHGFFSCYEAFVHIIDSMFNQHAKWLKVCNHIPWRRPIGSLNYLLSRHVWRQDHNGFSHQDPGLHRSRGQQEGRSGAGLPAAGCQLPAVGDRPLPAQPQLRQRCRGRQAACAAMADDGRCRQALPGRSWHLGMGQQRSGRRARRGHGLLRRRADTGDAGRGGSAAAARPGCEGSRRQCRRSDDAAAADASTRTACPIGTTMRCSPATGRSSSPSTAIHG